MNISTVAQNLRNTIASKEKMLKQYQATLSLYDTGVNKTNDFEYLIAIRTTAEFLEINIHELKRILADVEVCAKQASDDSWITNPDRMGGGGWTQEEMDPNRGWK